MGSAHTLKYKLDQHIGKTTQLAAEHYSVALTAKEGVFGRLKELVGVPPEPYEIPFTPTETEIARLEEFSGLRYHNRNEFQQTVQRELLTIMRQGPGSIGLRITASASEFVGEIAQELGGVSGNSVEINALRRLHSFMKGGAMNELQIYPEFGVAIENRLDQELS